MSHKLKPAFKKIERPIILHILEERQPPAQGCRDYTLRGMQVKQRRCIGKTRSGEVYMFTRETYYDKEGEFSHHLDHAFQKFSKGYDTS